MLKLRLTKTNSRFFAALLGYACLACLFLFPIFQGETFLEISNRQNEMFPWKAAENPHLPPTIHHDQTWTYYPWQVFLNRALRAGELPLWNPDSFAGHPFLANGQSGIFYLPRTLLALLVSPARVHDGMLLTHLILGGFFMFLFLDVQRLSGLASFFGGLAWMLNSFTLGWLALDFFVVVVAWLPLLFYLLQYALTRQSWPASVGCGVVLALFFLGGNLLFVEISLLAWGAYAIYLSLPRWWKGRREPGIKRVICRDLALISSPVLICAGLVAIQLMPNFELVNSIQRIQTRYSRLSTIWKMPWRALINFFIAPPLMGWRGWDTYHRALFLGLPTACLAVIGFWQRAALARYARALGLVVLAVTLGTPALWVAYHLVPGFGHIRPLGRLLFLFTFAASILAAYGLDAVLRWLPVERLRPSWSYIENLAPRLQSSIRPICALVLSAIVVAQMFHYSQSVLPHQPNTSARLYPATPLIQHLIEQPEHRYLALHQTLDGSVPLVFPLHNTGGYESLLPERINIFWRVIEGKPPRVAAAKPLDESFRTAFSPQQSRLDLLPRIGVTHFVTPPFVYNLPGETVFKYGQSAKPNEQWRPLVGDWNGDGKDTIGLYEAGSGTFHLRNTNSDGADDISFHFGESGTGWLPLAGDWDGDSTDTIGAFDPKTKIFHLRNANSSGPDDLSFSFAPQGQDFLPLVGDWNGDGVETVGLYEPMTGAFYLRNNNESGAPDMAFFYGSAGQGFYPVAGDWNGDGLATIGIYHSQSGTFMLSDSNTAEIADYTVKDQLADERLIPLIGAWRDGQDALGLYDPEQSQFVIRSGSPFDFFAGLLSYSGYDGRVYKLQEPLPRAYVTSGCESTPTPLVALERFCDPAFDPSRAVLIEDQFLNQHSLRCSPPDQSQKTQPVVAAQILKRSLNTLTLRANASQQSWLVINESWDEGWQATIDDQPTPVLPGNYLFRALPLSAGEHTVELRYQPKSFVIGRAVSVGTFLFLLWLTSRWLLAHRHRRFAEY